MIKVNEPRPGTPDETQRRAMAAARLLFVRKGYFNTSISDIVAESGVSIGSLYHHFGSKQGLALRLYEETLDSIVALMEERVGQKEGLPAKLRMAVALLLESADRDPLQLEYMLFVKHDEIQPNFVPICMSKPFLLIQGLLRSGVEQGLVKDLPVPMLAAAFMGIPIRLFELKLRGMIDYPLADRTADVFAMCWDAVRTGAHDSDSSLANPGGRHQ
ncbi:MAG TPA: TetR/AcrR family transcriptional regulator [Symbiobacteriaceae bacterium]